jgi:hypothetical protein
MRAKQRQGGEYTVKMPSFKQTILLVGTPAVLLVGGLSAMAASASAPTATPSQQTQPAAEQGETADAAESATGAAESTTAADEAAEANEPAVPGGGHADAADQNADHQFEGVE